MLEEKPDLIAFETIPSNTEARAIVRLLDELGKSFSIPPAYISFSCRNGLENGEGNAIEECAKIVNNSDKIIAFGINCTSPIYISQLIEKIINIVEYFLFYLFLFYFIFIFCLFLFIFIF